MEITAQESNFKKSILIFCLKSLSLKKAVEFVKITNKPSIINAYIRYATRKAITSNNFDVVSVLNGIDHASY